MLHLYQTMIQPVLTYGSDVKGVTKIGPTEVDKVFDWILRLILRVKLNTSKIAHQQQYK